MNLVLTGLVVMAETVRREQRPQVRACARQETIEGFQGLGTARLFLLLLLLLASSCLQAMPCSSEYGPINMFPPFARRGRGPFVIERSNE